MPKKEIETEIADISIVTDNIIRITLKNEIIIDPEDVLELKSHCKKLMKDSKFGVLISTRDKFSINRDAWRVSVSERFDERTKAKAILIKNPVYLMLGKMSLKVDKPFVKTKFFSDEKKALKWLEKKITN